MSYNGMSKRIKNALKTLLAGITYDTGTGSEPAFVSVIDNTEGEFDGFPCLRILPADVTSGKASTAENERTVNFVVRVHLLIENTPKSKSQTYDWMYDLTDLIIDSLDNGDYSGALNTIDNTLGVLMLNATRGDWMVAETNSAAVLMCDVNVGIRYSKLLS